MLPLEGITVVSLEQAIAAPFATRQLADLGARVIKVERPRTGDFARHYDETVRGMCSHFVWTNRSKESLTLDLKHDEAKRIMNLLLDGADIFVQNLAPGAAERLGLGAKSLSAHYHRLIVCDISGYGSSGPYRDKKAYDLLAQCETGLVSVTGTPETPCKVGISVADIAAGMYAYTGILTALYQREKTGQGAAFEVSLFDALGEWMSYPAYFTAYGGAQPARTGASHASIGPYGPFPTGDGKEVNLAVQNDHEWAAFCEMVLDRPDLIADPRFDTNSKRVAERHDLYEIIREEFGGWTAGEIVERLDRAAIANARMNSVEEFCEHPQLDARDRWREVGSPVGPIRMLLPPVAISGAEPRMDPVPGLGEHTEQILRSLGYDDARLERLRAEQAI